MPEQEIKQKTSSAVSQIFNKLKFQNLKIIHSLYFLIPLLIIYPKPVLLLLNPVIKRWSKYYRQINKKQKKPLQIILTTNPKFCLQNYCFQNIQIVRGQVPLAIKDFNQNQKRFSFISKFIDIQLSRQILKEENEYICFDFLNKKTEEVTFNSNKQNQTIQDHKMCESNINFDQKNQKQHNSHEQQLQHLWVQNLQLHLKMLQFQSVYSSPKYIVIKANQRILQLFEAKVLGLSAKQIYKVGYFQNSKLHILRNNKRLNSYQKLQVQIKIK